MTIANGKTLPATSGVDLDGSSTTVADLTAGRWSVVLIYRGHW